MERFKFRKGLYIVGSGLFVLAEAAPLCFAIQSLGFVKFFFNNFYGDYSNK